MFAIKHLPSWLVLLPRTGELFLLRIDPAKIYLFDAKNKQALQ